MKNSIAILISIIEKYKNKRNVTFLILLFKQFIEIQEFRFITLRYLYLKEKQLVYDKLLYVFLFNNKVS